MMTEDQILEKLFGPERLVPVDVARSWSSVDSAIKGLVAVLNGETWTPLQPIARDEAFFAERDTRILQLQAENPKATQEEIAELAGVSRGVVKGVMSKAKRNGRPPRKSISRSELDVKMWDLWKQGKTPDEISDELCAEGYYYGESSVRRRLAAQGAEFGAD